MRNAVLDTTAQVAPLVMAQSFAQRGISVHLALAHPPSALPAPIKRLKVPARKITVSDVRQDTIAFWAQHRPIHALKERIAQIWVSHSKPSAFSAQQGWLARKQV